MAVPAQLFKYLERKHALAMIERGEVQLGTLYDFRDIEKHGTEVGDAEEGKVRTTYMNTETDLKNLEAAHWVAREALANFSLVPGSVNLSIVGGTFRLHEEMPDCLIYCTATQLSVQAMHDLKRDTAVRILDADYFFSAIYKALRTEVPLIDSAIGGLCIYEGRDRDGNLPRAHPGLLKGPNHVAHSEYRGLFFPVPPDDLRVRLVSSPEIAECCELVSFSTGSGAVDPTVRNRSGIRHCEHVFQEERVFLDGNVYANCRFEDCELVVSGVAPFVLNGSSVHDPIILVDGPAARAMASLSAMYSSGARAAVEAMFAQVREGNISSLTGPLFLMTLRSCDEITG